jgi:hypothetical protein
MPYILDCTFSIRSEFPVALRTRRGNRNSKRPPVRHSRAGGNPVFISRAQALPGHGYYCGRAAPSLPSQAEPGTEKMLFLSSVAAPAAKPALSKVEGGSGRTGRAPTAGEEVYQSYVV